MDVTRENFTTLLPEIETNIKECDFIALDCEFTGLKTQERNKMLDDYEEHYQHSKDDIKQFQVIQVGLTTFRLLEQGEYEVNSYNFYILPRKCTMLDRDEQERYFLIQSSSITFLSENGFDFNKLFKEGITYVNLKQRKEILEKDQQSCEVPELTGTDKKFLDDSMEAITKFVDSPEETKIVLPPANSYLRRCIYLSLANTPLKDKVMLRTDQNSLVVTKCSEQEKREKYLLRLGDNLGFSEVMRYLVDNKKIIVGHNAFFDLLYICHNFIYPLPETYGEFKMLINRMFPVIYDTKFMAWAFLGIHKGDSKLETLVEFMQKPPYPQTKFVMKNVDEADNAEKKYHQAGYDSYITGVCFAQMVRQIFARSNQITHMGDQFKDDLLEFYRNKLYVVGIHDIAYFNLEVEVEQLPNRDHIFYLTYPPTWTKADQYALFSAFGGLLTIKVLNDTSSLCALKEPNSAVLVHHELIDGANVTAGFKVRRYIDYLRSKQKKEVIEPSINGKNGEKRKQRSSTATLNRSVNKSDETKEEGEIENSSDEEEEEEEEVVAITPPSKKLRQYCSTPTLIQSRLFPDIEFE